LFQRREIVADAITLLNSPSIKNDEEFSDEFSLSFQKSHTPNLFPPSPVKANKELKENEKAKSEKSVIQTRLDLGQKNFGPTTCHDCGMGIILILFLFFHYFLLLLQILVYSPGTIDDATHAQFHKKHLASLVLHVPDTFGKFCFH